MLLEEMDLQFALVLLEKCLRIDRSGSVKEMFENYKPTNLYSISFVVLPVSTLPFVDLKYVLKSDLFFQQLLDLWESMEYQNYAEHLNPLKIQSISWLCMQGYHLFLSLEAPLMKQMLAENADIHDWLFPLYVGRYRLYLKKCPLTHGCFYVSQKMGIWCYLFAIIPGFAILED